MEYTITNYAVSDVYGDDEYEAGYCHTLGGRQVVYVTFANIGEVCNIDIEVNVDDLPTDETNDELATKQYESYCKLVTEDHLCEWPPYYVTSKGALAVELPLEKIRDELIKVSYEADHRKDYYRAALNYIQSLIDKKSFKEVIKTPCKPGSDIKALPTDLKREVMSYL